jgi:predicted DsbA family dithiol-disulfide isomerase
VCHAQQTIPSKHLQIERRYKIATEKLQPGKNSQNLKFGIAKINDKNNTITSNCTAWYAERQSRSYIHHAAHWVIVRAFVQEKQYVFAIKYIN